MGGRVLLPVLHEAETITSESGTTMRFNCGDGHLSHSHGFKVVGGLRPGAGCFWASGPRCQARLDGCACGRDGTQRDDSECGHMLFCSKLRYASIVNLCVIRPVSQRNVPDSSTSYGLAGLRLRTGRLDPGHVVQQLVEVQRAPHVRPYFLPPLESRNDIPQILPYTCSTTSTSQTPLSLE